MTKDQIAQRIRGIEDALENPPPDAAVDADLLRRALSIAARALYEPEESERRRLMRESDLVYARAWRRH